MSKVTRTEAIKNFLVASTHSWFSELYHLGMEVQINVAQDGGERIENEYKGRKWHGWTDGLTTWKSFRIPYNANKSPEYTDRSMSFDLAVHAEGIGMTGWDWQQRKSCWVAFDFDAIVGHSERHAQKMDDAAMRRVEEAAVSIPWVTVHRSTSGKGLHLYVFLDLGLEINNHHEHAALARAILGTMSAISGFDFTSKVDVCGGNMWVWHRKMKGTDGLAQIKKGQTLTQAPENWKDHLNVITGQRRKVRPSFLPDVDDDDAAFEELTGQHQRTPFDEEHKKLIEWLGDNGARWWWDNDHHMLVTHTYSLKRANEALSLRGIFDTISTDDESGQDHNCFAYPLRRGAWIVRRYTPGAAEKSSWDQDAQGWTRCYLNQDPDLRTSARSHGGIEHPSGGYIFREGSMAQDAALKLGVNLSLPTFALGRKTKLKQHKDGRLIAEFDKDENDQADENTREWLPEGKTWKRVFNKRLDTTDDVDMGNFDDICRHIITDGGDDQGWVFKSDGQWINEPMVHLKVALQAMNYKPGEVAVILGSSVFKPWVLINEPFQPEYSGDRRWNRNAPQLRFVASNASETLSYVHWLKILEHLGKSLDEAVNKNGWCKANGIVNGSDYLKCWVASVFQNPLEPLPYLFFWSAEQNTGKSIFHEALELLITKGYARADQALQSQQGFNGELANSVLCVVEETDLKRNVVAYNRIKDWVTARLMPIQQKYKQPYLIPNSSHWVQCANDHRACPVFQGDTRITMIHVEELEPMELIPKRTLLRSLEKEAPDFLAAILNLELPPSPDRLNLPVLETEDKIMAATANESVLETFLREKCHHILGAKVKYGELYDRFHEWLDVNETHLWTKQRMGRELPPHFPKGRVMSTGGQYFIGNLSFEPGDPQGPKLVCRDEKLVAYH